MTNEHTFVTGFCNDCDISLNCHFKPGSSKGQRNSVLFIAPSTTKTEMDKAFITNRKHKAVRLFADEYGFDCAYTSLVKCPSFHFPRDIEIERCSKHLRREIFEYSPKIIVSIGDVVTKQFIDYTYFKHVVDKPTVLNLNNREIILYPIHNPNSEIKVDINTVYSNSFDRLAKIYKAFVDTNYIHI